MGCNSHVAIEVRGTLPHLPPMTWECFAKGLRACRWYPMYAAMADVRNDGTVEPISPPRGMPDDASRDAIEFIEQASDHSYTWLTVAEYREALTRATRTNPDVPTEWHVLETMLLALEGAYGVVDVRVVIGFAN